MSAAEAGIIGYGTAKYDKRPRQTLFGYLAEAAREALASAGVHKDELDGLAIDAVNLAPDTAVTAAEFFGISVAWAQVGTSGGAGPLTCVANAVRAVQEGLATYVLCLGGGAQDVSSFQQRISRFNSSISDYLMPHGFGGMPGLFAIIQRKHMEQFGTTRHQLGRIAVDLRANAQLNENALLRAPMSLDDYLSAPPIAEPLGLYDCVMPCSGGRRFSSGLSTVYRRARAFVCSQHASDTTIPWEKLPRCVGDGKCFASRSITRPDSDPRRWTSCSCTTTFPSWPLSSLRTLGSVRRARLDDSLKPTGSRTMARYRSIREEGSSRAARRAAPRD